MRLTKVLDAFRKKAPTWKKVMLPINRVRMGERGSVQCLSSIGAYGATVAWTPFVLRKRRKAGNRFPLTIPPRKMRIS